VKGEVKTRIVSLLPSATEIVAALGFQEALVGRSHECDFPEGVERLPVLTEAKLDPRGTSEEIHRRVDALLAESLSVYRVEAVRLRELSPTHVVTQVQCDVCAVSLADVETALAEWAGEQPKLVALKPSTLEDAWRDIERVAAALGAPERGRTLVSELRARLARIAEAARAAPSRPRVATIEWLSPLMTAGNWMPELVRLAGGIDLFGAAGRHSDWIAWEEIVRADPDALVVLPCGFSLDRVEREMGLLTGLPAFGDLSAVRTGRVYLTDGNQYFNRPGPRLVESLEVLAEILHPELFAFGPEGRAWKRLGRVGG